MGDTSDKQQWLKEKRIEAILDERRQLRQELILFQRMILGIGPLILTVVGGLFVATISKDVPQILQANRGLVLGFLNQLLFFLGLYLSLIVVNGQIHNRYIAQLEHELNSLLGKPTCIWEISGDAFQPPFIVLSGLLFVIFCGGFFALVWLTYTETRIYWLLLFNIAQIFVLAGTFTYQFIWGDKHYDRYIVKLKRKIESEQCS